MTINTKATKRVLIVDDQPHVLDVLREIIARFQHGHAYEITTARSVADALVILQRECFDLILLDMVMPGIGDLSLAKTSPARAGASAISQEVEDSEPRWDVNVGDRQPQAGPCTVRPESR